MLLCGELTGKGKREAIGLVRKANSAVQTRDDSSQDEANSDGGGEKWLD